MTDEDPTLEARRLEHGRRVGVDPDRVVVVRLDPWLWAARRGLKPLPGREIPPEYRHLFENATAPSPAESPAPGPPDARGAQESLPEEGLEPSRPFGARGF